MNNKIHLKLSCNSQHLINTYALLCFIIFCIQDLLIAFTCSNLYKFCSFSREATLYFVIIIILWTEVLVVNTKVILGVIHDSETPIFTRSHCCCYFRFVKYCSLCFFILYPPVNVTYWSKFFSTYGSFSKKLYCKLMPKSKLVLFK